MPHSHLARGAMRAARLLLCLIAAQLCACASAPPIEPANQRLFDFAADTLSFDNQLTNQYQTDAVSGKTVMGPRNADAHYTLRCFVLTRSVRQFFQFARFAPERAPLGEAQYRALVRQVLAHDPRQTRPIGERIVIPGYADLKHFSRAREALLKQELGGAVQSYLQRGNWRMIWPFSADGQQATAQTLRAEVEADRPPVVHLLNFPHIDINHALLLYQARDTPAGLEFLAYDPNDAAQPRVLYYDRAGHAFRLAPNLYFAGGAVKVYEVYRSLLY